MVDSWYSTDRMPCTPSSGSTLITKRALIVGTYRSNNSSTSTCLSDLSLKVVSGSKSALSPVICCSGTGAACIMVLRHPVMGLPPISVKSRLPLCPKRLSRSELNISNRSRAQHTITRSCELPHRTLPRITHRTRVIL